MQSKDDFHDLQDIVENLDNSLRKWNTRLRGLKAGEEGDNLAGNLEDRFANCAGDDCDIVFSNISAFHMGLSQSNSNRPRDVLIRFSSWQVKLKVWELFFGGGGTGALVEASELKCFPDLSSITLQKKKGLKLLTVVLQQEKIPYRWGYPF